MQQQQQQPMLGEAGYHTVEMPYGRISARCSSSFAWWPKHARLFFLAILNLWCLHTLPSAMTPRITCRNLDKTKCRVLPHVCYTIAFTFFYLWFLQILSVEMYQPLRRGAEMEQQHIHISTYPELNSTRNRRKNKDTIEQVKIYGAHRRRKLHRIRIENKRRDTKIFVFSRLSSKLWSIKKKKNVLLRSISTQRRCTYIHSHSHTHSDLCVRHAID